MRILAYLAAAIVALPGIAHASWYELTSSHFTVIANGRPDDLKTYIGSLERYDAAMRKLYNVADPGASTSNRVTVYVVHDENAVEKLAGGYGVLGFYRPEPGGPVAFATRQDDDGPQGISAIGSPNAGGTLSAQAVLFHEYAHHFMFMAWPDTPLVPWLVEGFAEYNGPSIITPNGDVDIGAPPNYRAFGIRSAHLSISDLFRSDMRKMTFEQVQGIYGRGWLLFYYLRSIPNGRAQLSAYFDALKAGTEPVAAAEKAFGDLNALDRALDAHANGKIMGTLVSGIKVGNIDVRPLTKAEIAILPVVMRSRAGVNDMLARQNALLAERIAKRFPDDLAVQNALAEAEFDAKHYEAADVAAANALAIDSKSLHALIYRGRAEQAIVERDKISDPARWQAVRGWYAAANRADTEDAEPLQLFYRSFVKAGETPSKNAEDGLIYAESLAPFDSNIRFDAAAVLLSHGKLADARTMLQLVAANPHAGKDAEFASKVLAELDAKKVDQALTDLRNGPEAKPKDKKNGSDGKS